MKIKIKNNAIDYKLKTKIELILIYSRIENIELLELKNHIKKMLLLYPELNNISILNVIFSYNELILIKNSIENNEIDYTF